MDQSTTQSLESLGFRVLGLGFWVLCTYPPSLRRLDIIRLSLILARDRAGIDLGAL